MDGQQWLATVFTPALERHSSRYQRDIDVLRGQIAALHECDVIDDSAHAGAMRRLDVAQQTAATLAMVDTEPTVPSRHMPAPVVMLQRVLAVAQPLADVDGITFVLTSVELWSNGVDVFIAGMPTAEALEQIRQHEAAMNEWMRLRQEGRTEGALSPPDFTGDRLINVNVGLYDDRGTTDGAMAGSAGGTNTEWRLHHRYEPGVPEDATLLTVAIADRAGRTVAAQDVRL